MANARTRFNALAAYLQQHREATQGRMYGKICLFFENQPFIVLHQDSVAFRLNGRPLAQALALKGAVGFDPLKPDEPPPGRPGWVLVPTMHFLTWDRLAMDSMRCMRLAKTQNVSWQPPAPTPPPTPPPAPASTPKSLAERVAAILKSGFGFGLFKNDK